MVTQPRLLLASASPRRRALIALLGLPVSTTAADVDERPQPGEPPEALARRLGREKTQACAKSANGAIVVAADSVVVLDGQPLGKPENEQEARGMLRRLGGRPHQVVTALALLDTFTGHWYEGIESTDVYMRPYTGAEIDAYVRSGSPMDKAGAYGIQDAEFGPANRLAGCYLNVVGLPLCEVVRGLAALGHTLRSEVPEVLLPPCSYCHQGARLLQSEGSLNSLFRQT